VASQSESDEGELDDAKVMYAAGTDLVIVDASRANRGRFEEFAIARLVEDMTVGGQTAKARIGLASDAEPLKYLFFDPEAQKDDEDAQIELIESTEINDYQIL
jgi:hypothetical protein